MARKVNVNITDTINAWRQKVNTMSDYIGDLDDLDTTFDPGDSPYAGIIDRDSDLVSALNYMQAEITRINNGLFNGTGQITLTAKIAADSADFDKIHTNSLYNFDSAMPGPGITESDYLWFGDSPGTAAFDFNADSAKFRNLNILKADELPDSATFDRLIIGESGFISKLYTVDSTATITFGTLKYLGNSTALIDSALVLNVIKIRQFISDSGGDSGVNIDTARITNLYIDSSITFADSSVNVLRQLLVADSSGTIQYAGYLMADS